MRKRSVTSAKKKKRLAEHKVPLKKAPQKALNFQELIQMGDDAMVRSDVEQAIGFYTTAINILRNRLDKSLEVQSLALALEKSGEAKVANADPEGARADFASALEEVTASGVVNLETHEIKARLLLYLGQLNENQQAFEAYQQGIAELKQCLQIKEQQENTKMEEEEDSEDEDESKEENQKQSSLQQTRQQLCGAYCTVAELYLTDLCFEPNAESECESNLTQAMALYDTDGESFVDALQTLASLRLSQNRASDAISCMQKVYSKIKTGCEALAALVGLRGDLPETGVELLEVDAVDNLPGYEFRCQTAKLLLECSGSDSQCAEAAIEVLGSLVAENDEVAEIWYLIGCAFAATNPPSIELALQYWERTLEMLASVKQALEEEGTEDEEARGQLEEIAMQMEEVQSKLSAHGYQEEQEQDDSNAMEE